LSEKRNAGGLKVTIALALNILLSAGVFAAVIGGLAWMITGQRDGSGRLARTARIRRSSVVVCARLDQPVGERA
jgi:hypothetical protein